ncbi:MAG: TonB-dependent receptor [Bryobacteraceae bacterium]|nr:TonB-dependent receptor [Bryobacteraceae bacterium]
MKGKMRSTPLSLVLAVCFASALHAGQIRGRVLDPSGAAAPNADVQLLAPNQTVLASTRTQQDGSFTLTVPSASRAYSVVISKPGFVSQRLPLALGEAETIFRLAIAPVPDSVVVTAEAGIAEAAGESVQSVNSVSRSQLDVRTSTVLSGAFREEPGVDVQQTAPSMGGVAVRGLLGRNVAVFRDGVRFTTSAQRGGVSTFFNLQDPTGLEAIEVLRGPNSAQYGSDSIGGAVHMLSRAAPLGRSGWHGELAPTYYSPAHAFGGNALLAGGGPRWGVSINTAARRVNTLRAAGGVESRAAVTRFLGLPSEILGNRFSDTAFTQYGGALHAQYALAPTRQVVFHYERSQQDGVKRWDQLLGGDGNLIADVRNLMLDFGYARFTQYETGPFSELSGTISYNAQREERVNQGGNGNPLAGIAHQYERIAVWGTNFYASRRFARHLLLFGGDGYSERMSAPAFTYNPANNTTALTRPRVPDGALYRTYGLYLQHSWEADAAGRLRLTGALRFGGSSYRVRGNAFNPSDSAAVNALTGRIGASWRPFDPLVLHATYSRGFRAPSITDLGTLGIQGNGFFEASYSSLLGQNAFIGDRADDRAQSSGRAVRALRSETSDNYDAGFRLTHSRFNLSLTGFTLRLNDPIVSQTLILPQGAVGRVLGDQVITRQLPSGAVFVPIATNPVLIRGNLGGARMYGVEHTLEAKLTGQLSFANSLTWIYARDLRTSLPPDIEGGIPPLTANPRLRFTPRAKPVWMELYSMLADRQDRLSSLALADRRTGASRSRANIASFFNNGARVRGLVQNGLLVPTGETLAQVQNRVLGTAGSAPMYTGVAGYALFGVRGGWQMSERTTLLADFSNMFDQSHRGVSWGADGPGRGLTVRYRIDF